MMHELGEKCKYVLNTGKKIVKTVVKVIMNIVVQARIKRKIKKKDPQNLKELKK